MKKSFKRIPMSELRIKLPKLRRQIQAGNLRVVCTHYGEIAAFLLPLQDVDQEGEDISLTEFREQLTETWERLLGGTDCIYLTFHKRRVAAFVSTRFNLAKCLEWQNENITANAHTKRTVSNLSLCRQ